MRDKRHLIKSFATDAEYTRDATEAERCPNFWNYGPELTRPARAMKLWLTWRVLGLGALGRMIDQGFVLTETAEAELRRLEGGEIMSPANMAIVKFRYVPESLREDGDALDSLNPAIAKRLVEQNVAAALTTKLYGRTVIRICTISPQMTAEDMRGVVKAFDAAARELSGT